MDIIRKRGINIEEIENVIFDGGVAACCTMKLKAQVTTEMLSEMRAIHDVLSISHTCYLKIKVPGSNFKIQALLNITNPFQTKFKTIISFINP